MKRLWENIKLLLEKLFSRDNSTEPFLHSAGATVRHKSPFVDLEVPRTLQDLDQSFLDEWVAPYYLDRFSRLSETQELGYASVISRINKGIIDRLLGEFNWRPRIVGAHFAALRGMNELEEVIGNLLLKSEVCYAGEGYCIALARFGTDRSKDYLKRYLDYYLTKRELYFDQQHALAALHWLDVNEAENYKGLWNEFTADKHGWSLEMSKKSFGESMEAIDRIVRVV